MSARTQVDEAAIRNVLSSYKGASNASDATADMLLYAEDGVFMPPNSRSAVGKAAVRKAYDAVFEAIIVNVRFTIAELIFMSPGWAFVRTNSAGYNQINTTGVVSPEGNRELFIFNKGAAARSRGKRWQT
jgi:uncharacterized protein (TIGR02246 family)